MQDKLSDKLEFLKWIKYEGWQNAQKNIDNIHANGYFKIGSGEEKFELYKRHFSLFEESLAKSIYPVQDEKLLNNLIEELLHFKIKYTDKEKKTWETFTSKEEVFKSVWTDLLKTYSDYFTVENLKAKIKFYEKHGIKPEINRIPNNEFIVGEIVISLQSENPTKPIFFEITKGDEVRKLSIQEYIDAHLVNWSNAISKQTELGRQFDVLHNARLGFSYIKYKYPETEKAIKRAISRLNDFENYIKYKQSKTIIKEEIISPQKTESISKNITPVQVLSPEEEWEIEAKKQGISVGTAQYYNYIRRKKNEQKEKEDEEKRRKEYDYFVGANTIYCPNMNEFRQLLHIKKMNPSRYEFMNFLYEEKIKYTNAKRYYEVWGGMGGHINRYELYGKIIEVINIYIEDGLSTTESNVLSKESTTLTPSNTESKETDIASTSNIQPVVYTFDYNNKEGFFFNDKIENFKEIENKLIQGEFIDSKGKWSKEKRYLVALIHILYILKYMRPQINNKSGRNTKLDYRRFFEKRYQTDLSQEMKPSKFPATKIKEYKFEFHFIPEIDKI